MANSSWRQCLCAWLHIRVVRVCARTAFPSRMIWRLLLLRLFLTAGLLLGLLFWLIPAWLLVPYIVSEGVPPSARPIPCRFCGYRGLSTLVFHTAHE